MWKTLTALVAIASLTGCAELSHPPPKEATPQTPDTGRPIPSNDELELSRDFDEEDLIDLVGDACATSLEVTKVLDVSYAGNKRLRIHVKVDLRVGEKRIEQQLRRVHRRRGSGYRSVYIVAWPHQYDRYQSEYYSPGARFSLDDGEFHDLDPDGNLLRVYERAFRLEQAGYEP